MPAKRVSMRRVREILRLKHECRATDRAIARALGIARSTVGLTVERVAAAGLRWPLPATLTDRVLEAMLYSGRGATLITSQIPVDRWHDLIGDPTFGDAILDRIVHNAHRLQLSGDSLRKHKAPNIAAA